MIANKFEIKWSASIRIEQVYNNQDNTAVLKRREIIFKKLKQAGLKKLFLGVESGSSSQLARYNKGCSAKEIIEALKLLVKAGIDFSIGFIPFDPLVSVKELRENLNFIKRTDILADGEPLWTKINYLGDRFRVLKNSSYLHILRQKEAEEKIKLVHWDKLDLSIMEYQADFINPLTQIVADNTEEIYQNCISRWRSIRDRVKIIRQGKRKEQILKIIFKIHELFFYYFQEQILNLLKYDKIKNRSNILNDFKRQADKIKKKYILAINKVLE